MVDMENTNKASTISICYYATGHGIRKDGELLKKHLQVGPAGLCLRIKSEEFAGLVLQTPYRVMGQAGSPVAQAVCAQNDPLLRAPIHQTPGGCDPLPGKTPLSHASSQPPGRPDSQSRMVSGTRDLRPAHPKRRLL